MINPSVLCDNVCGEGTILLHGDAPPAAAVNDSPSSKGTRDATPPPNPNSPPLPLPLPIKKRLPNTPRPKISWRSTSQSSFNRWSTLSCACCAVHSLAWRNAVRTQCSWCPANICWRDAPCKLASGCDSFPPTPVAVPPSRAYASMPSFFSSSILPPEDIALVLLVEMLARRSNSRALRPNLAESNP